jgi:nucleoside-diphosphate-sugar epimerase
MNILIVGGAGEVGKYLIKDLAQQGPKSREEC